MGSIIVDDINCKNLLNSDAPNFIGGYATWFGSGKSHTISKTTSWGGCVGWFIPVKAGEVYTFSYKQRNSEALYLYIREKSAMNLENGTILKTIVGDAIGTEYSFTIENDCYLFIMFDSSQPITDVLIEELQLEKGTVATNYSEYKGIGYTSGQNANGSWIKFEDGTMICDIIREYDFTTTKPWGALYESDYINLGNLPQTFIEPPTVTASCVGGTYVLVESFTPTVSTLGSTWFIRPIAQSDTAKTTIAFIVKGKWK